MDWSDPIVSLEPVWCVDCLPHFEWVMALTEGLRHDAIGAAVWRDLLGLIDMTPYPRTVAQANERWREFVAGVWTAWVAWVGRRQAQARARRSR